MAKHGQESRLRGETYQDRPDTVLCTTKTLGTSAPSAAIAVRECRTPELGLRQRQGGAHIAGVGGCQSILGMVSRLILRLAPPPDDDRRMGRLCGRNNVWLSPSHSRTIKIPIGVGSSQHRRSVYASMGE
ncbi:hypothetical protein PG993_009433 [Apiospora rasikravindrae]|uniref:Uncharacterized protein n=1 Tax=Apiospora rasikravindrae TaxID=990691 RepID=A0ABR1SJD4_9PEZI